MTLPPIPLDDALAIARRVAAEAAALLRTAADVGEVRTKTTTKDLVTEWDTRIDALIARRLDELAPGVPRLAEESGASSGAELAELIWVIDPIDGTVNFAHGLPFFAVCIALQWRGQPVCGVVHAPALGWEFHARRGGGAWLDDASLRVSSVAALDRALLATGFPYDRDTPEGSNFPEWEHMQRVAGACRRYGSAALDLCMVARGWFDGYWERWLHAWDVAAGAVIVEEAGGRVTSITGGPFDASSGEAVASNGVIHDDIVRELALVARRRQPHG
jgi:myo-inositol-1(or 4)-monophosphatase